MTLLATEDQVYLPNICEMIVNNLTTVSNSQLNGKNKKHLNKLLDITTLLVTDPEVSAMVHHDIITLYQQRWRATLAKPSYRYDINSMHPTNQCFLAFADLIAGYIYPDIAKSLAIYRLVFPTVTQFVDIFGQEISEFSLSNIIIVGDEWQTFLSVDDCLRYSLDDENHEFGLYHTALMGEGPSRRLELSPREVNLITMKHPRTQSFIAKLGNIRSAAMNKMYSELIKLRNGIREGDVYHGGEEMTAGASANIAIAEFAQYIQTLSSKNRQFLFNLKNAHEERFATFWALWELFDQPEYSDNGRLMATTCLQLRGNSLEYIINDNRNELLDKSTRSTKRKLTQMLDSLSELGPAQINWRQQLFLGTTQPSEPSLLASTLSMFAPSTVTGEAISAAAPTHGLGNGNS